MRYKRVLGLLILIGVMLFVTGCGGPQNPLQIDSLHVAGNFGKLFSGLWDGFWALLGLVFELFNNKYGIYDVRRDSLLYDLGYVLGLVCFLSLFFGGRTYYVRRRRVLP
jgi:hypothetical protein